MSWLRFITPTLRTGLIKTNQRKALATSNYFTRLVEIIFTP
jgi:hypothetical protein